jgi:hypothetical protein
MPGFITCALEERVSTEERVACAAIPNQRERKQTMIHILITAISTNLPIPHILPGAITGLLIAASAFLWLKRGNRSGAIMLLALAIIEELQGAGYSVPKVERKEKRKSPAPPFTTSTLQQEASKKLGFSLKETMKIAQELYERKASQSN